MILCVYEIKQQVMYSFIYKFTHFDRDHRYE